MWRDMHQKEKKIMTSILKIGGRQNWNIPLLEYICMVSKNKISAKHILIRV